MRFEHRTTAAKWVVLMGVAWLITINCSACDDALGEQVRAEIAPAVSGLFSAFGDLAGAWSAAVIRPVVEEPATEPSLQ